MKVPILQNEVIRNYQFLWCGQELSWSRYLGRSAGLSVSTQISKQANSRFSGPQLIRGQLYSHSECIINVYTQLGAQHSHRGSYRNFSTSKYVEEVIVGDELDEGNLSLAAGAGEDKS